MTSRRLVVLPPSYPRPPPFMPVPSAFEKGIMVESTQPIQFDSFEDSSFRLPTGVATLPSGTVFQIHERKKKDASDENVLFLSNNALYRLTKEVIKERIIVVGEIKGVPHDQLTRNPRHGNRSESVLKEGIAYLMASRGGSGMDSSSVQFQEGTMVEIKSRPMSNRTSGRTPDGNIGPGFATDKTPLSHVIYDVDVLEKIRYKVYYLSRGYVEHSFIQRVHNNAPN